MIKAIITMQNGEFKSFKCEGHAGYARRGKDIVCAAVSVLTINTCNAIDLYTESKLNEFQSDGFISFEFVDGCDEKAALLMKAMQLGLEQISNNYSKLLKLEMKEV